MNRVFSLVVFLAGSVIASQALASYDVVFSPNPQRRTVILESLDEAVNTVDIAMYGLSDSKIKDKIKAVAQNGIWVRMMLHKASKRAELAQELEEAGVDVRYTSRTNHNKFVIVDGPQSEDKSDQEREAATAIVLTGSGNFSRSATTTFDDDLVIIRDNKSVSKAYQHQFNWLWKYSLDFEGGLEPFAATAVIDFPARSKVAFSSENIKEVKLTERGWKYFSKISKHETGHLAAKIIEAIDSIPENGTLEAAQNHFLRRDIYEAIVRAVERGVEVSLVLDGGEFDEIPAKGQEDEGVELFDEALSKLEGVDVRYKTSSFRNVRGTKQMHLKYIIVNGKYVITGSYNWSDTSERKNWENIIQMNGARIVEAYRENFADLQEYGSAAAYRSLLKAAKARKAKCLYAEPITLTTKEMAALHKAFGDWDPCKKWR